MPVDKSRYPQDWNAISLRIRERDGWRCKFCGAENGKPHPITGSKVVLTVAHLHNPDPMCVDTMTTSPPSVRNVTMDLMHPCEYRTAAIERRKSNVTQGSNPYSEK